jgi:hypothetical protein
MNAPGWKTRRQRLILVLVLGTSLSGRNVDQVATKAAHRSLKGERDNLLIDTFVKMPMVKLFAGTVRLRPSSCEFNEPRFYLAFGGWKPLNKVGFLLYQL